MHGSNRLAVTVIASGLLAAGFGAVPSQAAPLATGLTGTVTAQHSQLLEKVHGRHCGWSRGHRHSWACERQRPRARSGYRAYDPEQEWAPYKYSRYNDYPFWANKAFVDAEERGGNGRR